MWTVQACGRDGTPRVWRNGSRTVQCMSAADGGEPLFAASDTYTLPGLYNSLRAAQMAHDADRDRLARLSEHTPRPLSVDDVRALL